MRLLLKDFLYNHVLIANHFLHIRLDNQLIILTNGTALQNRAPILILHSIHGTNVLLREGFQRQTLCLNLGGVDSIFAIVELDNVVVGITHRAIVLNRQVLHRLNKLTLNVTCIGGFDSSINQTLAT